MRFFLSLVVIFVFASPSPSWAGDAGKVPRIFSDCEGIKGPITSHKRLGKTSDPKAYYLEGPKHKYYVFLFSDDPPEPYFTDKSCDVFPLGRAAARVWGQFTPGKEKTKAYMLVAKDDDCSKEYCPCMVGLRTKGGDILAAYRSPDSCESRSSLKVLKTFKGQDSLQMSCGTGVGTGESHKATVLHMLRRRLTPVLRVYLGSSMFASPDEKADGSCDQKVIGSIRVKKRGKRPILRVVEELPDGVDSPDDTTDCRKYGYQTDRAWNAKTRMFESQKPGVPKKTKVCDCD